MKFAWKQITVALVCGMLGGFFVGTRFYGGHFWGRMNPEKRMHWMLERLTSKLHLTADQTKQVADILEAGRKKMMDLRLETRPKFEGIRNETNAAIRKILNPDQQSTFDRLEAEWKARLQKRRDKWEKH